MNDGWANACTTYGRGTLSSVIVCESAGRKGKGREGQGRASEGEGEGKGKGKGEARRGVMGRACLSLLVNKNAVRRLRRRPLRRLRPSNDALLGSFRRCVAFLRTLFLPAGKGKKKCCGKKMKKFCRKCSSKCCLSMGSFLASIYLSCMGDS
jgi:hypothetical protein